MFHRLMEAEMDTVRSPNMKVSSALYPRHGQKAQKFSALKKLQCCTATMMTCRIGKRSVLLSLGS